MLTPEYLDMLPDSLDALFQQLDDFIIRDYARRVAKAGKVTETAEWLSMRAEEIGLADSTIKKEVARILKLSDAEIATLFEDAAFSSAEADAERFESAGLSADRITQKEFLKNYIEAAYKQTQGEFKNFGNTLGFVLDGNFAGLTEFYRDRLDFAQLQISTGTSDYRSAIRRCVKEVAARGVQRINYESGYRMNVASAARMVTLTGVNQMARQLNEGICDELNLDIVEITAHEGARPSHQEWQGRRFSRSGRSKDYPPLIESTGLGSVDGLCGANCRHNYFGVVPSETPVWTSESLKDIDPPPFEDNGKTYTFYEASQRMRYMERQIRKTKRESIGYEAAGLEEEFTAAAIKLNRQKAEYIRFSRKAGIRPKLERTEELGYGHSIASRSAWRVRKENV